MSVLRGRHSLGTELLLSPFYGREKGGAEKLVTCPSLDELVSSRARVWVQGPDLVCSAVSPLPGQDYS